MTVTGCFESTHRFKTLRLCTKIVRSWAKRQVVFAGSRAESFSLREMRLAVSLEIIAARRFLKVARALGQDGVQIGGGVHVRKVFQTVVRAPNP